MTQFARRKPGSHMVHNCVSLRRDMMQNLDEITPHSIALSGEVHSPSQILNALPKRLGRLRLEVLVPPWRHVRSLDLLTAHLWRRRSLVEWETDRIEAYPTPCYVCKSTIDEGGAHEGYLYRYC